MLLADRLVPVRPHVTARGDRVPGLHGLRLPAQARDVPLGRAPHRCSAIADDNAAPPAAVDTVETKPLDPGDNLPDGRLVERDEVRVTPHEADPGPVLDDSDGVTSKQCPAPIGAGRPVQDRCPVEVAADPGEGSAGHGLSFVIEQLDAIRAPLNPLLVSTGNEYASIEGISDVDVRAVEVRVGHADGVDATCRRDLRSRIVV